MAVYAIGDVQGRLNDLLALLEHLAFDRATDQLWFTGDLVNRGLQSADVLRFVLDLGARATAVLGNHDLHLLAVAAGGKLRPQDTFHDVLDAPDRNELLEWLRHRPLIYRDSQRGYTLVHAGLPTQWDAPNAEGYAREVQTVLLSQKHAQFFKNMYGSAPDLWAEGLTGWERLRFITNCLTRIRYCDARGRLNFTDKGPPGTQLPGFLPWFEAPGRKSLEEKIIFGHWATLQLTAPADPLHNVHHLDTGCAWGGKLTAMDVDTYRRYTVPCLGAHAHS